MQTSTISAGRAVTVVVGAVLVTGCGGGTGPSAPATASAPAPPPSSSSATVPFGQKAVLKDLRAAVAAAGLPRSTVEAGLGVPPERLVRAGTQKERKVAALATRLTPCAVSWSPAGKRHRSPGAADPAGTRRRLDAVLSGLAARGWQETAPSKETSLGDDGTYFMASYEKEGWFLHARHAEAPALDQVTVMATEEACFARVTDEERALVED
ncbi:hypothetical protein SUDANB176_05706 [Streptomyces sp. enrichment culture]|uniref:hypothetical protein n=1 Tax=Streptomyces sp. enrichment culture TaxID=1795815 RepID=UPI003F55407D